MGKEITIEAGTIKIGKLAPGGVGPETRCILEEIQRQLKEIQLRLRHVMHVRVMLAGPIGTTDQPSEDFATMNEVYKYIFMGSNPPPTRDTVGGCELLDDARVEMVATAWKPDSTQEKE